MLTAAGILPVAVMAGIGLYALAVQQRAQTRAVGLELARSVAAAIDAETSSSVEVLEAISTSLTLDRRDIAGFRESARRVLRLQKNWEAIVLADPSGKALLDTRLPSGAAIPPLADTDSFQRAVRTRAPAIGDLVQGPLGEWLFAVRVPAVRGDRLRFVVTAFVRPEEVRSVLTLQHVPADWVISIVDAKGLRVARSRAHEENIGGRLSSSVQKVVAQGGSSGFGLAEALEGERIYTPWARIGNTGWIAVLGIPAAPIEQAVNRSLAVLGGGVLFSLLLAAATALWLAHSVNRPMAALREAARALGRRQTPLPPTTSIQEIREVAETLASASDELGRFQAEREELLRKERAARQAAEAADRAKEEFMAVLSHELRTPLNAVYGWARMLQSGELKGEALVTRAVDAIVRNADVQVQLIDDLLDLSRITSGKMHLDVRQVEMEKVLQGAHDAVRPAAEAKAIRLETYIDPQAGRVAGDASRLQQVVWNLLMNAVKFTPRGGNVRLHLRAANSHVEIVVTDTGQGIAPDMLPHVFERFRQADSSTTRKHGGLGLGLALVKHLVELHGGTVQAQSAGQDQGATFIVTLPCTAPDSSITLRPPPFTDSSSEGGIVRLDGVRVLVVDDDKDAVKLSEAILARAGAEVRTCLRAEEALDALKQWQPDVLVSDIEMPGEDGYSLIRKVRALAADEGGDTPAVALTAYGRMQDRHRAIAAGYDMHVPKPVDPGELTAIIAGISDRPLRF